MEQNNNDMQIPEHCVHGWEIAEGFGRTELLRATLFTIVGLIIGILVMILVTKEATTIVLSTVIGSAGGYIFCKKDRYSRVSEVDRIMNWRKFCKSQKYYEWRK